jgi:hypothetical protein
MHLSGAVYAEYMLRYGASDGDCIDPFFVASVPPCDPGERPVAEAYHAPR